jgi:hypothetical protein
MIIRMRVMFYGLRRLQMLLTMNSLLEIWRRGVGLRSGNLRAIFSSILHKCWKSTGLLGLVRRFSSVWLLCRGREQLLYNLHKTRTVMEH